jgi:hypothetical protein
MSLERSDPSPFHVGDGTAWALGYEPPVQPSQNSGQCLAVASGTQGRGPGSEWSEMRSMAYDNFIICCMD